MLTLETIFIKIQTQDVTTKRQILECGATHLAVDSDGSIYAYKGKPVHMTEHPEWRSGDGENDKVCLWCGDIGIYPEWKDALYELP